MVSVNYGQKRDTYYTTVKKQVKVELSSTVEMKIMLVCILHVSCIDNTDRLLVTSYPGHFLFTPCGLGMRQGQVCTILNNIIMHS